MLLHLANINLELHPGKVNAIIGENGAGKSTLMKIFSGVHTQYEGEIIFNGRTVQFSSTKEAEEAGIAIIHQELNLVPYLSIAENIFLGREITNAFGMLDKKQMREKTKQLLSQIKSGHSSGYKDCRTESRAAAAGRDSKSVVFRSLCNYHG